MRAQKSVFNGVITTEKLSLTQKFSVIQFFNYKF